MSNFADIPFLSPFKFVPNTSTPGMHFDDDWMYNQIKSFETKRFYYQKWQRGDATPFQVACSFLPDDLKIYNSTGSVVKSFPFTIKAAGGTLNYSIYETADIDIDNLPDGIYFVYFKANFLAVTVEAISEPIWLKDNHPNTLLFEYYNTYNDHGVIFTTGIQYKFRCEAGIMDFQPDRERAAYTDQIHNVVTNSGTAFRTFKLFIGEAPGVAPWVFDLLNRIYVCNKVFLSKDGTQALQYETTEGAKWDINRVKGFPLYGGSIEIIPAQNKNALQLNDLPSNQDGILLGYNIETDFFGTGGADRAIIEIENN
jgi:hypothetical protein